MTDTKARILDAAERLIAEHGLDVSLRTITAEAGVNLAAVNYHFQSKDALIDAVIGRRIQPINEMRLDMLNSLEREYPRGPLPLEEVMRAFLAPVVQMPEREHLRVLFGRFYNLPDEFLNRVFFRHLQPILARFQAALARAAPELTTGERTSCMLFTAGAMVHIMAWSRMLGTVSSGAVDPSDTQTLTDRLVAYASGGFRGLARRAETQKRGIRHA